MLCSKLNWRTPRAKLSPATERAVVQEFVTRDGMLTVCSSLARIVTHALVSTAVRSCHGATCRGRNVSRQKVVSNVPSGEPGGRHYLRLGTWPNRRHPLFFIRRAAGISSISGSPSHKTRTWVRSTRAQESVDDRPGCHPIATLN